MTGRSTHPAAADPRGRLLEGLPVAERRLELAGVSTMVLGGGQGSPVLLLHGPGESAANWRWVIPDLVSTHRVIAPDLPAHGESRVPDGWGGPERVLAWVDALVQETCPSAPAIVGHVLGGAIAARFALARGDGLRHVVLVDTLGLGRFRPMAPFALSFLALKVRPSERSYLRFMRQCAYDLDGLQTQMGEEWDAFVAHNVDFARSPEARTAGRLLREVGLPPIPPQELDRIDAPVALIWGRHDRANRLHIAEAASARYGWPLHVIDAAADDPARDQPQAFLEALRAVLGNAGAG